jgi:hypothetical protein
MAGSLLERVVGQGEATPPPPAVRALQAVKGEWNCVRGDRQMAWSAALIVPACAVRGTAAVDVRDVH